MVLKPPPYIAEAPDLSTPNMVAVIAAVCLVVAILYLMKPKPPRPPHVAPAPAPQPVIAAYAAEPVYVNPVKAMRAAIEDRACDEFLISAGRARVAGLGLELGALLEVIAPTK